MEKIITILYAMIILLYNKLFAINYILSCNSFNLINTEKAISTKPDNKVTIKYNVPIFLAFENYNHFFILLNNEL